MTVDEPPFGDHTLGTRTEVGATDELTHSLARVAYGAVSTP